MMFASAFVGVNAFIMMILDIMAISEREFFVIPVLCFFAAILLGYECFLIFPRRKL